MEKWSSVPEHGQGEEGTVRRHVAEGATLAGMKIRPGRDHEHAARGETGTGRCVHGESAGRIEIRSIRDAEASPHLATRPVPAGEE